MNDTLNHEDKNDPNWQEVYRLVKEGSIMMAGNSEQDISTYEKTVKIYEQALALCIPGAQYGDFSQLYALYGCTYCLYFLIQSKTGDEQIKLIDTYIKYCEQALKLNDDFGKKQMSAAESDLHGKIDGLANTLAYYKKLQSKKTGGKAAVASGVPALDEENYSSILEQISVEKAQEKYHISDFVYGIDNGEYDGDGHAWCVYHGNLHVASVDAGSLADTSYYSLIVDGNLTVDGDIDWWEELGQSLLMVTGNLQCRNLFMGGCPQIVVKSNLTVGNGIIGRDGDNGGVLTVDGNTTAKIVYCTTYFNMKFKSRPKAVMIGDTQYFKYKPDYNLDDAPDMVLPEYCDDENYLDPDKIKEAFIAGENIMRPKK